jgi:hypothetical protein
MSGAEPGAGPFGTGGPAGGRVPVRRLSSRNLMWWLAGTAVLVLGVLAWVAATQPQNRWAVAVLSVLLVVVVLAVTASRTWIEPGSGTVVRQLLGWRRQVQWASATTIALVPNRAGVLLLGIRRRRWTYLPVLALTDYVQRSQPPELLYLLADQIDRFAPTAHPVALQLRGQADQLVAGVPAANSPLAPLVRRGVLRAAKAGGLGGLLD